MTRNRRLGQAAMTMVTLLASAALLAAQPSGIVYVTDELRLGLYRTEETSGRSIKTLISGARLEILERSLMSVRVRAEDGAEGWVKTAYLVEIEPARRRLASLEQQQAVSQSALAAAESAQTSLAERAQSLQQELDQVRQDIIDLPALQQENATLKESLQASGILVPMIWVIAAALSSFFVGWFAGNWWLDRKVRRTFGGVRVY